MLDDVRFAIRSIRHKPFVIVVAAATLALGIGGATVVFSVVDAVILRSLPFHDPERLVRVWELTRDGDRFSVPDASYLELAATSRTLQPVAAYKDPDPRVLNLDGQPQRINVVPVSASFAAVLGVGAQLGRMFTTAEDQPAMGERRLMLSDSLWRTRFHAQPDVIGRVVRVNGRAYTVTGVMPRGFEFPGDADAWVPLAADANADRSDKALAVIARIVPEATLAQVTGELREMTSRWSRLFPESYDGWSAHAVPFREWIISPRYRDGVWVLFGAVTMLLLLACANVANLLLAQATSRRGEMRVRAALGAPRRRLVRQLFIESALLAAIGTAAGILVAVWSIEAVRTLGGNVLPRLDDLTVNGRLLLFACATGVISCMTFGLVPAAHTARVSLRAGLEEGIRYTARNNRVRHALVILELAVAMLLLVGAGLLGNSLIRLFNVDPGFDVEATLAMPLEHAAINTDRSVERFYAELLDRVRAIPGVVAAGATATNPFRQFGFSNNVTPAERAAQAPPSGLVQAGWRSVTPGFFDAMRVPVVAGRSFDRGDHAVSERVAVLSQSLAERLWPGESALGRRLFWGGVGGTPRTVIGVVGDVRDVQLDAQPTPLLYVPHAQVDLPDLTVIVRTSEPLDGIAAVLRQIVREFDATLAPPIESIAESRLATTMAPRFNATLLAAFAAIAFTLALVGVYALLAFTVAQRRREIAVRVALGASSADIAGSVLRNGLTLSLIGALFGLAAAVGLTQAMSRLLYGVRPTDPPTFIAATLVILTAAAIASYLPARRAARINAAVVLTRG